jgi:uncharacterized protein with HEPN domain
LVDLIEFGAQAARLVAKGKSAWEADEFLRLAGDAILHRIGEAVARVTKVDPQLIVANPQVRWRAMKGTRNRVAHQYQAVDYDIVWNALARDLPHEVAAVRRILDGGD